LKIDVMAAAIRGQRRFEGARTLVLTGERGEESTARAAYKRFEPHRTDPRTKGETKSGRARLARHVDHWRPIIEWPECRVWEIMRRFRVNPHPAYRLGWGRVSCAACIFGNEDQWASLRKLDPKQFARVAGYEAEFMADAERERERRKTLPAEELEKLKPVPGGMLKREVHKKGERIHLTTLSTWADRGTPYAMRPEDIQAAMSETWNEPIILPPDQEWKLPAGAYGDSCGPT